MVEGWTDLQGNRVMLTEELTDPEEARSGPHIVQYIALTRDEAR